MKRPPCPKCQRPMGLISSSKGGKPRWLCRGEDRHAGYCYCTTDPSAAPRGPSGRTVTKAIPAARRALAERKRYIITAAQNATPVHEGFLATLKTACKYLNAELIVIPMRYKNATSCWTESQANAEWWAPELVPYLYNQRKKLNPNLVLLADVKIQPTAAEPLSGLESFTGTQSAIVGHPKLHLRSVPTPSAKMAKVLSTTGVLTVKNYTDSRAGKKGEFHHSLAALIVEIDGPLFFLRQLNADAQTGEFTDLETRYTPTSVRKAEHPLALVMGDTHVDSISPAVERATFGKDGIVPTLRPQHIVHHDLLDAYAVNGHHVGNPFNAVAKRFSGRDSIRAEIERAIQFVLRTTPEFATPVIVASNHDDMVKRWIVNQDWREDPTNAEFYLETALHMVRNTKIDGGGTSYPSPFPFWVNKRAPDVRCLGADESFVLGGVELGLHGDRGPNGARGSIKNLRNIGIRSIIGHSHSPGISDGAYQTGTSTHLKLEYSGGISSWLNAHVVLHADGKRQMLIIVGARWRL